ncbi:MAG: hypothetical protein R3C11_03070 [Planctomycetaceae bacterium]
MKKIVRVSTDLRSNLVAYLDGELDEETSRDVEQLLAKSEVARHDVEMLSRSFDLLDMLPKEKASEQFTQQTLATISALENQIPLADRQWFQWSRRLFVICCWFCLLIGSAYGGYIAGQKLWPSPTEQILEDFDFYNNLDHYEEVGEIEFLKQLQQQDLEDALQGIFPEPADPAEGEVSE